MTDYQALYRQKKRTPEDAALLVKSGDWVDFSPHICFPSIMDKAIAARVKELTDVKLRSNLVFGPIACVEADPLREHFVYNSWHCSAYERRLCDKGLCNYIPMIFRNLVPYYTHFLTVNVAIAAVTPMDAHGFFNLSAATGVERGILEKADVVILEINDQLPYLYGGFDESVHISEVDYIVEGEHDPLPVFPVEEATKEDIAIAKQVLPYIPSGATIQLGIGSMPNVIGSLLAKSDLEDLGMHTELCSDAYYELYKAGKLTNRKKSIHKDKGMTGLAFGSADFYRWIDRNPSVVAAPLSYVNSPEVIGKIDNMISINNCIAVDLYGQISAESVGLRQISGTGGQLDYLTGAAMSRGGKAFICMTSCFTDADGERHSRIVPHFAGDIVTDPRSQAYFLVTEYGCVNLVGRTTWERAEMLISIAHPDFREKLIAEAEKQKIWRSSNKR